MFEILKFALQMFRCLGVQVFRSDLLNKREALLNF